MNVQLKYTYRDLLTTPDDGNRYEILEGELAMTPAPGRAHQFVVANLTNILVEYANRTGCGQVYPAPFDVFFNDETVVEPDILFVSKNRLHIMDQQKVNGPPDIVIEVISESTEARDRGFKFTLYAKEGVKEYWIVDPLNESVEVYELTASGFALSANFTRGNMFKSNLLTTLQFETGRLFESGS